MRTLEVERATEPLSTYAKALGDDVLILMSNNEPIAAVVSLKNVDKESLSLSTNPEFMEIIAESRREFRLGKKLSLDEMEREVAAMN
jgi:PHD/YefM family antitoxin component YafN of YafNO toxin-antitoxin module